MTTETTPAYSPGLAGIIAGESAICEVRPDVDKLIYRGYDASELATRADFEETAHLLLRGTLPTKAQLAELRETLNSVGTLPAAVINLIRCLPDSMHMMDVLRCGVSALAGWDPDVNDNSSAANYRKCVRLMAQIPNVLGTRQAQLDGREHLPPLPENKFAANLQRMITGKAPDEDAAQLMNCSLTLYAEHGYNASTFTGRVITSTLSDLHSGVTGAIGALKGPLHGGANEAALELLREIGSLDRVEEVIMGKLARKDKIMGFGHRVYKTRDSRAVTLRAEGRKVAQKRGMLKLADIADKIEAVMKREKKLFPNVDFPCAWVYEMLGIPMEQFTPIFACARITGWGAHFIEQQENNRLIRPDCIYTGPQEAKYEPPK